MLCLVPLAALALSAAAPRTFDFKDPKGTNAVGLTIDSPLEPVTGYADGVAGSAVFDPLHPEKTTGKIEVAVSSVRFSHDGYTRSVRFYGLGENRFPKIACALKKIVSGRVVRKGLYEGRVLTDFTIRGVTRPLTIPIQVTYLPGRAYDRDSVTDGDLLVVRSRFTVSRAAFNVAQEVPLEMAGDGVEIRVALVGTAGVLRRKPAPALNVSVGGKSVPVTERMAVHKVPACSVALVRGFQTRWVKHFGGAGADTLYAAGQMSEPVAHLVALRLAQDGKLDLDADINRVLTRWKAPSPVTVRQLLSQSAGFTVHKYLGHDPTQPLPTLPEILADARPSFPPGSSRLRAAENASVLQMVLEDSQKASFPALVSQVLAPRRSLYRALPPSPDEKGFARGHGEDGVPLPHGGMAYPELAAAGLWTNADEYAQLLGALMACAAGKAEAPLKPEFARLAFAEVAPGEGMTFGYDSRGGRRYYFRGGANQGFYGQAWMVPETGDALIVFTNRHLAWQFANELRDTFLNGAGDATW